MAVEYWASAGFQGLRIQCRVFPEGVKAEDAGHVTWTNHTRHIVCCSSDQVSVVWQPGGQRQPVRQVTWPGSEMGARRETGSTL